MHYDRTVPSGTTLPSAPGLFLQKEQLRFYFVFYSVDGRSDSGFDSGLEEIV